jgi:hypothetical protein
MRAYNEEMRLYTNYQTRVVNVALRNQGKFDEAVSQKGAALGSQDARDSIKAGVIRSIEREYKVELNKGGNIGAVERGGNNLNSPNAGPDMGVALKEKTADYRAAVAAAQANPDVSTPAGFDALENLTAAEKGLNHEVRGAFANADHEGGLPGVEPIMGRQLSKTEAIRALDKLGVERGGNLGHFENHKAGYLNAVLAFELEKRANEGQAIDLGTLIKPSKGGNHVAAGNSSRAENVRGGGIV